MPNWIHPVWFQRICLYHLVSKHFSTTLGISQNQHLRSSCRPSRAPVLSLAWDRPPGSQPEAPEEFIRRLLCKEHGSYKTHTRGPPGNSAAVHSEPWLVLSPPWDKPPGSVHKVPLKLLLELQCKDHLTSYSCVFATRGPTCKRLCQKKTKATATGAVPPSPEHEGPSCVVLGDRHQL